MRRVLHIVVLFLFSTTVYAQPPRVDSATQPSQALSVRCVNTAGTTFESCGGSGGGASSSDLTTSASLTTTACPGAGCVTLALTQPSSTVTISVQGTFVARVNYKASVDGSIYSDLYCNSTDSTGTFDRRTQDIATTVQCNIAGYTFVRVWNTLYTSGTVDVVINATIGASEPINTTSLLNQINTNILTTNSDLTAGLNVAAIGGTPVAVPGQFDVNCVTGCASTSPINTNVTWDSTTALNTTLTVSTAGYNSVLVSWVPSALVGGTATFNISDALGDEVQDWYCSNTFSGSLTSVLGTSLVTTNTIQCNVAASTNFNVKLSAVISSGTVSVRITASTAGFNPFAIVTLNSNNFNLNQIAGNSVATNTGVANNGTLRVALASSSTVLANQSGTWSNKITDGTNLATVKPASTLPLATDTAFVVTERDPVILGTGSAAIGSITNTAFTANAGTNLNTSALALDATLTGRTAKTQITDGTRDGTVKAASTLPLLTDTAVVVTERDPLPAGTNVIGHVIADTGSTTAVTGTVADNISQVGGNTTVTGGVNGTLGIGGTTANNAAIAQNPVLVGLETIAQGTQPTAATAANQRRMLGSTEGVLYVQEGNSNKFSCFVQNVTVTTECKATPSAGLRAYVTSVSMSNEAATVQTLDIVFGTGTNCGTGTTALTHKWQFGTVATTTSPFVVAMQFPTPLVPTAANAICVRPSAATAFGATITGYIAP